MALYRVGSGNSYQRAMGQFGQATQTMGGMSKENQTSEYKPGAPPATQVLSAGTGLTGAANQAWKLGEKGYQGLEWLRDKFNAPKVDEAVAKAESGGQAVQQAQGLNGMQMNSGAQVGEAMEKQAVNAPDFVNGNGLASQSGALADATKTVGSVSEAPLNHASDLASQSSALADATTGMNAASQATLDLSADTAGKIGVTGPENVTGGLSGAIGPSVGGVAGGFAGRELGRAIGGDTGAAIGGVAGSLGGAYLGGLAMSQLAGGLAGEAGGAMAGAVAGSAAPGLGTFIGAGIGALTSLFL